MMNGTSPSLLSKILDYQSIKMATSYHNVVYIYIYIYIYINICILMYVLYCYICSIGSYAILHHLKRFYPPLYGEGTLL